MDRNYLKGQDGDRINAVLAAAGFNFHLLLMWLAALLRAIFLAALPSLLSPQPARFFRREELHGRLIAVLPGKAVGESQRERHCRQSRVALP